MKTERIDVEAVAREVWQRCGWGTGPELSEGKLCVESVRAGALAQEKLIEHHVGCINDPCVGPPDECDCGHIERLAELEGEL